MKDRLTNEIVTQSYEEIIEAGLPFLQIFPQMFQDRSIAETFKAKKTQRNKHMSTSTLEAKEMNVAEFREKLFLHCGISLNIFNLPLPTQGAFWFMLFNWIECNNYSITICPAKRKILAQYYSKSMNGESRSVQNIFRGLTNSGLLIKCKKSDSICKNNKAHEVTYRVPFIVSQQQLNSSFIKLNNEIILLKNELHERSIKRLKDKTSNITNDEINSAVNGVLNSVINKVSKRNVEALGKVQFSARIDFSADGGLSIAEIDHIESIEAKNGLEEITNGELGMLLSRIRIKKQKILLESNFLDLKRVYINEGKTAFNRKFDSINGLGRQTKKMLISHFNGENIT